MSVLELAADRADSGAEGKARPDSPLSLCLSLRWFRSHIVVLGVRPQIGQAAVVRFPWALLVWPYADSCFRWFPLGVLSALWFRLWVPVHGGIGVYGFPTLQCIRSSGWFCLRALDSVCAEGCFRSVSDSVGFYGSRVCGPTSVGGRGIVLFSSAGTGNPYWALFTRLTPLLPSARGSSSWELGVGRVAEAVVAPCVVSSSESECCELLYASELRVVFCKSSGYAP
ncbi:hypothetical protein Taro_001035 [Colocasia esculenta]|uniref:Uncharacterized protein n=1 Tax=Colocasia esculenta TaxID=4460 RepID=A0A843TJL4_COLES|nr:hypothetical protein [Colocasia esculenta]